MIRRDFLRMASSASLLSLGGCTLIKLNRIDPWHYLIRSDQILSEEDEQRIRSKGSLSYTEDGRIRVLVVRGNGYERGYQQGALLRDEVTENLTYMYEQAMKKFHFGEAFAEVYERLRPYIPQEYVDEMHGLAHGARLPLDMIHHLHALPSLAEWGGKKKIKVIINKMMEGELATSCSNMSLGTATTENGEFLVVRVLDWGLHKISKLHQFPLICINVPDNGVISANVGWVGFLGAISGMNAEGITLGEMGYGDPPNETLRGIPMPFLLRDVMTYSHNLADVRRIISGAPGECSYAFLMSDGKTKEAELYIKDPGRFLVFKPGEEAEDNNASLPAIDGISYGGRYNDKLTALLTKYRGHLSFDLLKDTIIPDIAMKSNFQNVIYEPDKLQLHVSNALNKDVWAASQPYTFFDLKKALARL